MAEKITEKIKDLVGEAVSNSGTANTSTAINLNGALTGHQTFATAFGTSSTDTVPNVPVSLKEGDTYQTGVATFTHGSPSTIQFSRIDKGGTGIAFTSAAEVRLSAIAARQNGHINRNSQTITTANPTVAVNMMHYLTISGLTANRNFTVPAGTAGDWIGVHAVTNTPTPSAGTAGYGLVIIGDTGVTINGGSAATEHTRLLIANESMILRCTAANTWVVEHDGRIPCAGRMRLTTGASGETAATWTAPTSKSGVWDSTPELNVGEIMSTSNGRVIARRAAKIRLDFVGGASSADSVYWDVGVDKNGASPSSGADGTQASRAASSVLCWCEGSFVTQAAKGDYYEYQYRSNSGSKGIGVLSYFSAVEEL